MSEPLVKQKELENLNSQLAAVRAVIGDKWKKGDRPGAITGNIVCVQGQERSSRGFGIDAPFAFQQKQTDMWREALVDYISTVDPDLVDRMACEISRLQGLVETEVVNAEHWRMNHAHEVSRARVLKERPDMPLERINAYDRMLELEKENDALKQRIASLEDVSYIRSMLQIIQSIAIDSQSMNREQLRYLQTHFQKPNGW